jgi:alcohol dehydrogenase, propanol-preferring
MKSMQINSVVNIEADNSPLQFVELPEPSVHDHHLLIKISVCGVCHTELDEIEGRTPPPAYPVVPGHQVVGRVERLGGQVNKYKKGDRVGVAWIYSACGKCELCQQGKENLCPDFRATGRDVNGGYAEYMSVPAEFVYRIPDSLKDEEAAPLLCAGAIGYRSLELTNIENGDFLGLTGFGASGHLVLRLVKQLYPECNVYVFARNPQERAFAVDNGAVWAGDTGEESPEKLHAIIDTTPAWKPVVEALKNLRPSGRLVINAIRKEDFDKDYLIKINYPEHLWMEKEIKSVANVTRKDVAGMLDAAAAYGIKPDVQLFDLEDANKALIELKHGSVKGAKVLRIQGRM